MLALLMAKTEFIFDSQLKKVQAVKSYFENRFKIPIIEINLKVKNVIFAEQNGQRFKMLLCPRK